MLLPPVLASFGSGVKSSVLMTSIIGAWFLSQSTADPISSALLEKIARESGFFALVLVLLYFYRRDTKWATEFWKDQALAMKDHASEIAQTVKENTKSNVDVSNAVRESTIVMHAAKRVMETHYPMPKRRDEDT